MLYISIEDSSTWCIYNRLTSPVKLYTRKVENKMKREAVNENVRFAALEKISFSRLSKNGNQT